MKAKVRTVLRSYKLVDIKNLNIFKPSLLPHKSDTTTIIFRKSPLRNINTCHNRLRSSPADNPEISGPTPKSNKWFSPYVTISLNSAHVTQFAHDIFRLCRHELFLEAPLAEFHSRVSTGCNESSPLLTQIASRPSPTESTAGSVTQPICMVTEMMLRHQVEIDRI